MINVTIDGKSIEVPEGTTVLHAAQAAGVFIPTLCDHPELTPYGGCRLCLVEVEGARTLQPSCTLPVNNNMVVHTDTEKVKEARKFVLTLIFSERNHFCPYCQVSGGDCELQNSAYREGMDHWPLQPNWQPFAVDASHPYFVLDNNRCILCRRCVRACGELVGAFTLGFEERGANSFLVADVGTPLGESTCVSCGVCVQICPTGALIDRQSAYRGKEMSAEHHETVCAGCSVGCGIDVLTKDNRVVRIEGNWDAEVNHGVLCKTGRFIPMTEERTRIVTPLVRKNGQLKAATWDEALQVVSSHLSPLAGKSSSGVAALASTRLTAEALSAFKQLFVEKLHSDMTTTLEEGAATSASSAVAAEMGCSFESRLDALDSADLVVTVGVDMTKEHEVAGFFIKRALPGGTKLVVIDRAANDWDLLSLAVKAPRGTDADVVAGLSAAVAKTSLTAACDKTGLKAEEFEAVAELLAEAKKPVLVYGKNLPAAALKSLVEVAGKAGAAVIGLKGDANSMAAAQYGLEKPFQLNGHQAVYVALGDDNATQRLAQRIEGVPFLAVQAAYSSQITAMADVVLPTTMWAEEDGHFLSLDGRLQAANKSINAPEGVRSNVAVLDDLAHCLGGELCCNQWKEELHKRASAVAITE